MSINLLWYSYFSLACASEGALEPFPLAYMPGPSSVMDGCDMIQNKMPLDAKNNKLFTANNTQLTSALSLIWWNMQPLKEGTTQRFAIKPNTRSFWFVSLLCFTGYVPSRRGFFVVKGKYTVTSSFWLSHMYVVMSGSKTGMLFN